MTPKKSTTTSISKSHNEPILILPLLFVHWTIGGGIAFIGNRMKNQSEFYAGLVFMFVIIGLLIAGFVYPCDGACDSGLGGQAYANCGSCNVHPIFTGLFMLLSLLSWVYIIARLYLIHSKKENTFKLI
jgi:hypothetical protein